jgi:hypothetical protein
MSSHTSLACCISDDRVDARTHTWHVPQCSANIMPAIVQLASSITSAYARTLKLNLPASRPASSHLSIPINHHRIASTIHANSYIYRDTHTTAPSCQCGTRVLWASSPLLGTILASSSYTTIAVRRITFATGVYLR